jgi:ribosomal protein S18 acetylase RimI-like enzyme
MLMLTVGEFAREMTLYEVPMFALDVLFTFVLRITRKCVFAHEVLSLKRGQQLMGFVDLSLQVPDGSLTALISRPLSARLRERPLAPYVSNFLIAPRSRKAGNAQLTMLECERIAREWGYNELFLHVEAFRKPALSLYTKCGFKKISGSYGVLFMRKQLSP